MLHAHICPHTLSEIDTFSLSSYHGSGTTSETQQPCITGSHALCFLPLSLSNSLYSSSPLPFTHDVLSWLYVCIDTYVQNFVSGTAVQDLHTDQYSGLCFSSVWILMQSCLTGYDFDTVPSFQHLNSSSQSADSSWLAERQEDVCACTGVCTAALGMLTGPPHMSLSDVWWWMGRFGPISPHRRCLASSWARQD